MINPDCPDASSETSRRAERVDERGNESHQKAVETCDDKVFLFAEFFVDNRVEHYRDHRRYPRGDADCPTACVAVKRAHADEGQIYAVTNENAGCLHRDAQADISAETEDVRSENYEQHFVVFEFSEHLLETHARRGVGLDHLFALEVHKKLEDESESCHNGCGDDIFGFADSTARTCENTHETDEYARCGKRNRFERVAKACGVVDLFTAI